MTMVIRFELRDLRASYYHGAFIIYIVWEKTKGIYN